MLYNQLLDNGFVIINLLNVDEVSYFNELCQKYLKTDQQDFISGSHFLSKEENAFINNELHKTIKSKVQVLFPDLELLGGTLATKKKGKSVLKAHNDWDIVNEKSYNSYNLWISLVDTDKYNGTLGLVPNSHLWQHGHRGFGIAGQFEQFTNDFVNLGIEPELKAGQAILYNHKLIHFSRPNQKDEARNVAIIGMKDKAASLQVSLSTDGQFIETYAVEEADFYGFNIENIKQKPLISKEPVVTQKLTLSQIKKLYQQHLSEAYKSTNQSSSSFIDKIKAWFQ